ncbi:MAG: prolyl oligopeptidase family serine peptidase [Deltaproteobacteria bacterium]|nr:prolyl oligopeptidase family serine peptidase [Deltaproteobacteria bacterium]
MISRFKRPLVFSIIGLMVFVAPVAAQDAGQVLRLSIGYNNLKKTAEKLDPEKRPEVEKLGQLAKEATGARKYGDALKYYYQAITLLRGSVWTPESALSSALSFKADRLVIEPSDSLKLHLGQIFVLDEKVPGKISGSIDLLAMGGDKSLKTIKTIESLEPDFFAHPLVIEVTVPEMEPGKYRLRLKLKLVTSAGSITKIVIVHIEGGLIASLKTAKDRWVKIEKEPPVTGKGSILTALRSARYQIDLIDKANAGEINHERLNFRNELREANTILDELEAGRDPFASRRGDFRKAYLSNVDHTLQPYRIFIPSTYDGSKAFPLIISLHGVGGDENSYFEEYGSGAFKIEAEERGYLVACPKGRQPASMYLGPAEQDIMDVIAEAKKAYHIDENRIYLTGHSMGGFGTWSVAMNHPQVFAALAPVAGGGNPGRMGKIAHIPQLVVHGEKDQIVSVERSRQMVEAAQKLNVKLKYFEIPDGDHDSVALQTFKEVFDWFDSHRRQDKDEKAASAGEKSN